MAGMMISTYLSFLPQAASLFCCIVLCIGFFGIFIPYQEHKKKKGQAQKQSRKQPKQATSEKPGTRKQLEQLRTLKTAGIISEEEYQEKKKGLQRQ